mgnify:CR=1 FL=1
MKNARNHTDTNYWSFWTWYSSSFFFIESMITWFIRFLDFLFVLNANQNFCFVFLIQQSNVNVNDDDEESFHVKNFPVNFIRNFFSCNLSSPHRKNFNSTGKKVFSLCFIRAIFFETIIFCKCFSNKSRTKQKPKIIFFSKNVLSFLWLF